MTAATVVVGIGAVPNDWLCGSGPRIDDGVRCDAYGRAGPHVYAVGDAARWYRPRRGRASWAEHCTSAVEQAGCAGYTIARPETPQRNDPIEYVWSDQYDWKIQIAGRTGSDLTQPRNTDPGVRGALRRPMTPSALVVRGFTEGTCGIGFLACRSRFTDFWPPGEGDEPGGASFTVECRRRLRNQTEL